MNLDRMSTATNTPNARTSRRGVVLGLLAWALGLATLRQPEIAEARKRKKRKKRNNGQSCQPGESIATINVPASGATISTPVLAEGQRYRLRVAGFWKTNATYGADAFAFFPLSSPRNRETTFQDVRVGLSVDGGSPDLWGTYHVTHNYEREVVGQDAALSLHYIDPDPSDNSGSLLVEVICV